MARLERRDSRSSQSTRRSAAAAMEKWDKNGCCLKHSRIRVAKRRLLGGWKELRECPKCNDSDYDDFNDAASFSSKNSRKSTSSKKSTRSAKSSASRKGREKANRHGALPFDVEGYCHAHPSVRLAKKKTLGGWKVIHDICPDCAKDAGSEAGSKSSRGRGKIDAGISDVSSVKSNSSKKMKIRVKDMKYTDETGREGRYSGDVNEDHQPHGQGKMKYKDGTSFNGIWSEGSQVHEPSKSKSAKSDWSRKDPKPPSGPKTVRKMKWMDYYGDPGEYTGEVDAHSMPHGKGSMKYDHGLIQDGLWEKGQFVDGSDEYDEDGHTQQKAGQASAQQPPPSRNRSSKQSSSSKQKSKSRKAADS